MKKDKDDSDGEGAAPISTAPVVVLQSTKKTAGKSLGAAHK